MTPRLPQELVDRVIDLVAIRESEFTERQDLKSCSLTARSWLRRSQRYILESVVIPSFDHLLRWASEIDPASGISSHVRTLTLCDNLTWRSSSDTVAQLQRHFAAFDRLERLNLKGFHIHSEIPHADLIQKWFGRLGDTLKTLDLESCSLSPNAFQSILHLSPYLDNLFVSNDCEAVITTEVDRALRRHLGCATHLRGRLATGANALQELLPCLLMFPLQPRSLFCTFSAEGYQIVSACAPALQNLCFEGSLHQFPVIFAANTASFITGYGVSDIDINPISFPELRTLEFGIHDWGDVDSMVCHYFPLIESAPNLSTVRIEVNEETKTPDILPFRDSSGWTEVDYQLCRLSEGTNGPVTLFLEVSCSLESPDNKGTFEIATGSPFLSEFRNAGGQVRFW